MSSDSSLQPLLEFIAKIPGIDPAIGHGFDQTDCWYVKFSIDTEHPLAWNVVQELGHVLNYLSVEERLPRVFKPVSPPPYMNGGPHEYLSWVIECNDPKFRPDICAEWLEGRLSRPVNDFSQWESDGDE